MLKSRPGRKLARMEALFATTSDSLYGGQLVLKQPRHGYRFGTDAMLLAAAIQPQDDQQLLELGCGVGAASLALAWRAQQSGVNCFVTGIELQQELYSLAQENMTQSGLAVRALHGDITDKNFLHALGRFDQVFCNPPYHPEGCSSPAGNMIKTTAHVEVEDGLKDWLQAANRFLKPKGIFTMIHRADRLSEILPLCEKFLGAIEIIPFWPKDGEPAKRIIIRGKKSSKKPLTLHQGVIMHGADGNYTAVAKGLVNQGAGLL
ncbi:MAG TPA: methyltransferase domain-containing protein [Alphaproteobacteria bacterium]